jgi:hypothetical protein
MTKPNAQTVPLRAPRLRPAALALGLAAAIALLGPAGAGARSGAPAGSGARYPAGATRTVAAGHAAARRKPAKKRRKPALHGNPARALLAFEAMQARYYIRGSGLYIGEPFSYLWPFSQALAATVTLANVPALAPTAARQFPARLTGLRAYLDLNNSGAAEGTYTSTLPAYDGTVAPPAGPGGPKY